MRGRRAASWLTAAVLAVGLSPGSAPAVAGPERPRALFFGDSLFAGVGAVPERPVQPWETARLLGWSPTVDAMGGTGFTTGGRRGRPYLDRLRDSAALARTYDVVVVEGGTNDAHHGSLLQLPERAREVLRLVRRAQPGARVVVVGAFTPAGPATPRQLAVDRVLRAAAAELGAEYVSQVRYGATAPAGFYSADGWHPTAQGYTVMARDLAAALRDAAPREPRTLRTRAGAAG